MRASKVKDKCTVKVGDMTMFVLKDRVIEKFTLSGGVREGMVGSGRGRAKLRVRVRVMFKVPVRQYSGFSFGGVTH